MGVVRRLERERSDLLGAIMKRLLDRKPWWLEKDAQIGWDTSRDFSSDAFVCQVWYMRGLGKDSDYREVRFSVTHEELREASFRPGLIVDLVVERVAQSLAALRPSTPTDEQLTLAMQAIQSEDALAVLADMLLDDRTISEPPDNHWTTPELARRFLHGQARTWAEIHLAERWAGQRQSDPEKP